MPQSDYWSVPFVLDVVDQLKPKSVMDFGVGIGQYGLHLRQLLDIGPGRLHKSNWSTVIDGIELFEPYRNPLWDYFYDSITIGDGRSVLRDLPDSIDLILICDVIEHFEDHEAIALLDLARSKATWVLVTTPNGSYPQGDVFGNEAERHRSEWVVDDFRRLGAATHTIRGTFLALFHGTESGAQEAQGITSQLPGFFNHTGRSLLACARDWFPRAVASRVKGRRTGLTHA